jgi:hypothetical protein
MIGVTISEFADRESNRESGITDRDSIGEFGQMPGLPIVHLRDRFTAKEGKRIGQQPDSKSGAPKGVGGSNPLPSALANNTCFHYLLLVSTP